MITDVYAVERSFLRGGKPVIDVKKKLKGMRMMLTTYIIGFAFGFLAGIICMKIIDRKER